MKPAAWCVTALILLGTVLAPPAARADIVFVADSGNNRVGEYDATTGAAINANFITGVPNNAVALDSSGHLFVAGGSKVGEYNATTGAAINANFITGIQSNYSLAVDNSGHLFVGTAVLASGDTVGEYSASTGAVINANLITGLFESNNTLALDSSGNLFITNAGNLDTVGKYNASTGAAIIASTISGLSSPFGLAVDSSGHLFVTSRFGGGDGNPAVEEYNATTGAAINTSFVSGSSINDIFYGLALDSSGHLFASHQNPLLGGTGTVGEYNASTGATINPNLITGLSNPYSIAIESSGSASVPEPNSVLLVSLAAVGTALGVWRQRRNKAATLPASVLPPG